jgi:hypothetical protein
MTLYKRLFLIFNIIVFLFLDVLSIYCLIVHNEDFGYSLDIPEHWKFLDDSDPAVWAFTDEGNKAVLQIFVFKGGTFNSSREIFQYIQSCLGADGDGEEFMYSDKDSTFATLEFYAGLYNSKGFSVFIRDSQFNYAILAYAGDNYFADYEDYLLSAIDSFSLSNASTCLPGPISYYKNPPVLNPVEKIEMVFNGETVQIQMDKEGGELTQGLIEREARILLDYQNDLEEAWKRYYRIIYRDNYIRLKSLAEAVNEYLFDESDSDREKSEKLLAWIQDFDYYRTGTVSDLTSPTVCAIMNAGDCDSRALLFVILLHYSNIDAVLLVSTQYSHSAAGVLVEGDGAVIEFQGLQYIYAEVTDKVGLGLVPQDMANPAGWLPVPLKSF